MQNVVPLPVFLWLVCLKHKDQQRIAILLNVAYALTLLVNRSLATFLGAASCFEFKIFY